MPAGSRPTAGGAARRPRGRRARREARRRDGTTATPRPVDGDAVRPRGRPRRPHADDGRRRAATPATATRRPCARRPRRRRPRRPRRRRHPRRLVAHDGRTTATPHARPFGDPAEHEVFGDPVADGYVPVVERPRGRRRRPRWVGLLTLLARRRRGRRRRLVRLPGAAPGPRRHPGLRPVRRPRGLHRRRAPARSRSSSPRATAASQIGRTLLDAGVVASVEAFLAAANANPEFTRVQPGTYTLPQQLPATDAVAALLDPANRQTDTLVIAEGLRVGQILDRLAEGTGHPARGAAGRPGRDRAARRRPPRSRASSTRPRASSTPTATSSGRTPRRRRSSRR